MPEFGHSIKESDFYFAKDHTHINHGSYGAVPKPVMEERLRLIAETERHPDKWFRSTALQKWHENIKATATFLGSKPENLVFVTNATTGCNAVVKSLKFEPGEAILVTSYTYNAVHNACINTMVKSDIAMIEVEIPLELPDKQAVVDIYRKKLEANPNIKLVLLDMISSCSAIWFPMPELIALCKQYNKLVLVDGAHVPGQVPLNLETLGADFFTGNLHKWVYAPRGCAVLWIHPDFHDVITPPMTSHGYETGSIQLEFFNQGTADISPFFTAATAIEFYNNLGGIEAVNSYCNKLLDEAVDMLVKAWGTHKFPIATELQAPRMRLVALPELGSHKLGKAENISGRPKVFADMASLMIELFEKYSLTTVCLGIYDKPWIRLSANCYNSIADYEKLRDAILDIKNS